KDVGLQSNIAATRNARIKLLGDCGSKESCIKTSVSTSTYAGANVHKKQSRRFRDLESQQTRNCRYSCVSLFYSLARTQNLISRVHFSQI
ncbi:unnamed protein product, partial [Arabidopsis halleri]